jgi:hypothetical protein
MMEAKDIGDRIAAPFYANEVEWKIQSTTKDKKRALIVPYIKARALMQRLDDAVGFSNWTDSYIEVSGGFNCGLALFIDGRWVTKNDASETVVMTTYDDGQKRTIESLKGTYTNAFKRACTTWGIGRYLYDIPRRWVPIDEKGKFQIPVLSAHFYPEGADTKGLKPGAPAPQEEDLSTPKEEKKDTPDDHPDQKESPQRERVVADESAVNFAKQHNIPEGIGVPLAGKTLGEALNDAELGSGIITYLAGIQPNQKKQFFDPGEDKNLMKLKDAALVLYDNVLHPAK